MAETITAIDKKVYRQLKAYIIKELKAYAYLCYNGWTIDGLRYKKSATFELVRSIMRFADLQTEAMGLKIICNNILNLRPKLEEIMPAPKYCHHQKSVETLARILQFCYNEKRTNKTFSMLNISYIIK